MVLLLRFSHDFGPAPAGTGRQCSDSNRDDYHCTCKRGPSAHPTPPSGRETYVLGIDVVRVDAMGQFTYSRWGLDRRAWH